MLTKRFTDASGLVHYFDKDQHRHGMQAVSPYGAFWKAHLNTIKGKDGESDTSAETFFSERLETPCDTLFDRIEDDVRSTGRLSLTSSDRRLILQFIYYQFKRPPGLYNKLESSEAFAALLEEFVEDFESDAGRPLTREERTKIFSEEGIAAIRQRGRIQASLDPGEDVISEMMKAGIFIGRPPEEKSFIVGSEPVLRVGHKLGENGAAIIMPLSSRLVVCVGQKYLDGQIVPVDPTDVRLLNEMMWQQSSAIAGASKPLIKSLTRDWRRAHS